MQATIQHGTRLPFMIDEDGPQTRPYGLDVTTQTWLTQSEDTFRGKGTSLPDRPLMYVKEVATRREGPGLYKHRVTAEGLVSPGEKIEPTEYQQPEEGWDEYSPTLYTTSPEAYTAGDAHPEHPNLYIAAPPPKVRVNGGRVWRVQPNYKGIILDAAGNIKEEKWKGTVNGETINTANNVNITNPALFKDENGTFNGFSGMRARFDASRILLTVTKLSTTPPPTQRVGLQMSPGHVPVTVYSIFDDPGWYAAAGFTANYPGGAWKLASVQFDQVLKKACFLYTLTFEYLPKTIPTL